MARLWPGWPGDKKNREKLRPQGQPGLASMGLARAKTGKEKRKNKWSAWPGKAMAGQGQNWQVKPCKEFTCISRKFKVWPAIQLIAPAGPPGAGRGQKLVKLAKKPRPAWPGRHYHVNFNN